MPDNQKKTYLKVTYNNQYYVIEPSSDANEVLGSLGELDTLEPGESIEISAVEYTAEEYAAVPEFNGF